MAEDHGENEFDVSGNAHVEGAIPPDDRESSVTIRVRNDEVLLMLCEAIQVIREERDDLRAELVALGFA